MSEKNAMSKMLETCDFYLNDKANDFLERNPPIMQEKATKYQDYIHNISNTKERQEVQNLKLEIMNNLSGVRPTVKKIEKHLEVGDCIIKSSFDDLSLTI